MSEPEQEAPEPSVGESELDVLITIRDLLSEIVAKLPTNPSALVERFSEAVQSGRWARDVKSLPLQKDTP